MFDTQMVNQQPTDEYGLLHRMLPLQPKHNPRYGTAQQKKETIPVAITTTSTYPSSAKTHHAKNKKQHTHGQSLPETRKDGNGITAAQTTAAQTKVRRCNLSKPYRGLMNMSPSKWNSKNQRITTNALGRQAWNTTQEEPPPLKDSTWHS